MNGTLIAPELLFPADPLTPPRSPTDDFESAIPRRPFRFAHLSDSLAPSVASRDPHLAHPEPPAKSPLRFRTYPRPPPSTLSPGPFSDRWGAASAQVGPNKMVEPGKSPLAVTTPVSLRQFWQPHDFDAYVREIKAMAAASPTTVLAKLQELAPTSPTSETPSQAEVERTRWMLSALRHLDLASAPDGGSKARPTHKIAPEKMHSILALYESKGRLSWPRTRRHGLTACSLGVVPRRHASHQAHLPPVG